jgi:hypothetical protein
VEGFNQKLVMVEANMDVKISDFDVTVEMLKKDFATGQKIKISNKMQYHH